MIMIRALLGDELWTQGLREYLRGQIYGTATWDQILSYWDTVADGLADLDGMTVTEVMEPYFRQMGYPVLKITMEDNTGGEGKKLTITTNRFLSAGNDKLVPPSSYGYKWHVPLVLMEGGQRRIHWLRNAGETTETYEVEL